MGRVTDARVQIAFSTWIRAVYYIRNSRLAMNATSGKVPERMSEVGDWPYEEHGVNQILSQGFCDEIDNKTQLSTLHGASCLEIMRRGSEVYRTVMDVERLLKRSRRWVGRSSDIPPVFSAGTVQATASPDWPMIFHRDVVGSLSTVNGRRSTYFMTGERV